MASSTESSASGGDQYRRCDLPAAQNIWNPLQPLTRQIRVLVLHPGKLNDAVKVELKIVDLNDQPEYEALSYCWGDAAERCNISLNGQDCQITASLHAALSGLRYHDRTRHIWADAICIDQSNLPERTEQVKMMGDIYRNAATVLCWLSNGPLFDRTNTHDAVDCIEQIARMGDSHFDGVHNLMVSATLFRTPWWRRIWTFQEIVLAKEAVFHTGPRCLSMETLVAFLGVTKKHLEVHCCCTHIFRLSNNFGDIFIPARASAMHVLNYRRRTASGNIELVEAIAATQDRQASDPRDRIFAMAALLGDVPDGLVDYERTVEALYIAFALLHIDSTSSLDILRYITTPHEEPEGGTSKFSGAGRLHLPSWCPNWDLELPQSHIHQQNHRRCITRKFNASLGRPVQIAVIDKSTLSVSGILMDEIQSCGRLHKLVNTMDDSVIKSWPEIIIRAYGERFGPSQDGRDHRRAADDPCASARRLVTISGQLDEALVTQRDGKHISPVAQQSNDEIHRVEPDAVHDAFEVLALMPYPLTEDHHESFQDAFRLTMCLGQSVPDRSGLTSEDDDHDEKLVVWRLFNRVNFLCLWHWLHGNKGKVLTPMVRSPEELEILSLLLKSVTVADVKSAYVCMIDAVQRQQLVVTKEGAIGLASGAVQAGDKICTLYGCNMPCILRRCDPANPEEPEKWRFIACAYVHGYMNGAAVRAVDAGQLQSREFTLI